MSIKRKGGKAVWRLKRGLKEASYSIKPRGSRFTRYFGKFTIILYIAIVAFTVFVIAGGIYDILEKPLAILPKGSGWTFIYSGSINIQTLNESIVSAIIYIMGILGFYMILRSTKLIYRPRQAYIMLVIGLFVTLVSVYYAFMLIQAKIGTSS